MTSLYGDYLHISSSCNLFIKKYLHKLQRIIVTVTNIVTLTPSMILCMKQLAFRNMISIFFSFNNLNNITHMFVGSDNDDYQHGCIKRNAIKEALCSN